VRYETSKRGTLLRSLGKEGNSGVKEKGAPPTSCSNMFRRMESIAKSGSRGEERTFMGGIRVNLWLVERGVLLCLGSNVFSLGAARDRRRALQARDVLSSKNSISGGD